MSYTYVFFAHVIRCASSPVVMEKSAVIGLKFDIKTHSHSNNYISIGIILGVADGFPKFIDSAKFVSNPISRSEFKWWWHLRGLWVFRVLHHAFSPYTREPMFKCSIERRGLAQGSALYANVFEIFEVLTFDVCGSFQPNTISILPSCDEITDELKTSNKLKPVKRRQNMSMEHEEKKWHHS